MVKKEHVKQISCAVISVCCLLTSDDSYRCDWLLLSPSFPKSACPTQALQCLWCFAHSQSFCQSEKPGVALGKACDDTFPPQSKHILAMVCQVRSQYRASNLKTNRSTAPWKFSEWIYRRLRIRSRTRSKAIQESSKEIYRSCRFGSF